MRIPLFVRGTAKRTVKAKCKVRSTDHGYTTRWAGARQNHRYMPLVKSNKLAHLSVRAKGALVFHKTLTARKGSAQRPFRPRNAWITYRLNIADRTKGRKYAAIMVMKPTKKRSKHQ